MKWKQLREGRCYFEEASQDKVNQSELEDFVTMFCQSIPCMCFGFLVSQVKWFREYLSGWKPLDRNKLDRIGNVRLVNNFRFMKDGWSFSITVKTEEDKSISISHHIETTINIFKVKGNCGSKQVYTFYN